MVGGEKPSQGCLTRMKHPPLDSPSSLSPPRCLVQMSSRAVCTRLSRRAQLSGVLPVLSRSLRICPSDRLAVCVVDLGLALVLVRLSARLSRRIGCRAMRLFAPALSAPRKYCERRWRGRFGVFRVVLVRFGSWSKGVDIAVLGHPPIIGDFPLPVSTAARLLFGLRLRL